MDAEKRRTPDSDGFSSLLLMLIALSGEFPIEQVRRLSGSVSYADFVVKRLKRERLIRTYYRDGLRGLRLTAAAKKQLAADWPDRFVPLFTGDTMTNAPKYSILHRLRLHRMAEVLVSMFNVGILSFPWEKPVVFTPTPLTEAPYIEWPAYYGSREVKNLGALATKIRNSRAMGLLLTGGSIFAVYNTGPALMKWEYQAEMRLKALLQIALCQNRLPGQFGAAELSAILFGSHMGQAPALLDADTKGKDHFIQDGSYDHFYFLTCDQRGDVILYLLLHPDEKAVLDGILSQGLDPARPNWAVVNDAMDGDSPVLFGYTCDMPRIMKFDNVLHIHGRTGTLYCFDFQEDAMRQVCGPNVEIRHIDFEAYEGSVFHQPQETD